MSGETRAAQRRREAADQRGAVDPSAIFFTGDEEPDDGSPREEDTTDHPQGASFTPPREHDAGDEDTQTERQQQTASARSHEAQERTTAGVARARRARN